MMKKTIICFAIVLAGLSAAYAGGGPKPAKVMGSVTIKGANLSGTPQMQDQDACAAYQTPEGAVSVSVYNKKGELNNALSMANATGVQVVGFKKYAVIVKAVVDGKVRFFSYKLGKKGVKVLGSTAPESTYLKGKNVIKAASDGKSTWVVTQDVAEDGTLGAKTLVEYTNKLEGTSKKAATPKTTYSGTATSVIRLPNVQNKYKYDIAYPAADADNQDISIKIIK